MRVAAGRCTAVTPCTTCNGGWELMYLGSVCSEHPHYCNFRANILAELMSLIECPQICGSPFLLCLDDDLTHFGDFSKTEPLTIGPSPMCDSEVSRGTLLGRYDPTMTDTRSSSLWNPQAGENMQYQGDELYLFDDAILLQGGSTGEWTTYQTQSSEVMAASCHDEKQINPATKAEPNHGVESQPIMCFECQKPFDNLQSLDQHTKTRSHKGWRCSEEGCGKTYPRRDTLVRHQLKHSPKAHACNECSKSNKRKFFARKDHLNEHIRKRHSPSTDSIHAELKKYEAMQVIVKSLETVLGEGHPQLKGLETTMSAMSSEKMAAVAETIAERMAQVAADPAIGCSRACNQKAKSEV
jgi:hypothetical protein